ncbi:MAG TPA: sulfatase [Candidatus Bathyarchaeia archaeon]
MNVVLLILDALRYDHVNKDNTPNLMRVAEQGAFFRNAFACNSSTINSIPCILGSDTEYKPDHNIASVLGGQGYYTAMIHSNPIVHSFYGGFRETIDLKSSKFKVSKGWKKTLRSNLPPQIIASMKKLRASVYEDDTYLPYSRAQETLEFTSKWMKDHSRYFLWVHLMDPHIPYYPRNTSLGISKHDMRTLNDKLIESVHGNYVPKPEEVETAKTLYSENIGEMDHEIGVFMEGFPEDTLLVVTSDHGEEFGEHGQYSHHSDKIVPELVHVPLIFYGAGVAEGHVVEEYVSNLSVAPTILESSGVDQKLGRGTSLWSIIRKRP